MHFKCYVLSVDVCDLGHTQQTALGGQRLQHFDNSGWNVLPMYFRQRPGQSLSYKVETVRGNVEG